MHQRSDEGVALCGAWSAFLTATRSLVTCVRCQSITVAEPSHASSPDLRDRLTARLTYLAVGLTDAGLAALVERAETLTVDHARPLTSGALAKAQQEREAAAERKQPEPDAFGIYHWPNVPCECPPDADPGERCSALWMCCDLAARSQQPYGRARCRGAFDVRREERETAEAFKPPAKQHGQRFTEADAEIQRRAAPVEQAAPMAGKVCVPEPGGL